MDGWLHSTGSSVSHILIFRWTSPSSSFSLCLKPASPWQLSPVGRGSVFLHPLLLTFDPLPITIPACFASSIVWIRIWNTCHPAELLLPSLCRCRFLISWSLPHMHHIRFRLCCSTQACGYPEGIQFPQASPFSLGSSLSPSLQALSSQPINVPEHLPTPRERKTNQLNFSLYLLIPSTKEVPGSWNLTEHFLTALEVFLQSKINVKHFSMCVFPP